MKKLTILGSTGSVGKNVLNVVRHLGVDNFEVSALAAHSNIDLLEKQALEFRPKLIAVYDEKKALELKKRLPQFTVVAKVEGVEQAASFSESDLVVNAIVGNYGLRPMLCAINAQKNIVLANKEVLVSAGELIMKACKRKGVDIIPIDSEHSAIYQCLEGRKKEDVERLIITASGGPFFNYTQEQLKRVEIKHALNHPTWDMGHKITIDSSTLMNKGFEVIEAHWLFGIPLEKIKVIIHPQSIVHSLVEFVDNTLLAQLGETDMVTPIQYALSYPKKFKGMLSPFDFTKHNQLQFFPPNTEKFACLRLAYEAQKKGESYPCYLNAANETLVDRFLNKKISWLDISKKLTELMNRHIQQKISSIEGILEIDTHARLDAGQI